MSRIEHALALLEEHDEDAAAGARYELSDMRDVDQALRDDRAELLCLDADRLAQCAAESRRLSLEECCYWLEVVRVSARSFTIREWSQAAVVSMVLRDASGVRYWSRGIGRYVGTEARLEALALRFICREALRRIEEERRCRWNDFTQRSTWCRS